MPVLTDPQINLITSKLQKILSAASSAITPVLTSTEFIGTFVDHNHYRQIKDVGDLIGGFPLASQCMTKITVDDMEADMQIVFNGAAPIPFPAYIAAGPRPDAPDHIIERFHGYIRSRAEMGDAFGDTVDAIRVLNYECKDARSMALFVPCLTGVFSRITEQETDAKLKAKHERMLAKMQASKFGELPAVPQEARKAMRNASDRVLLAMMANENTSVRVRPTEAHSYMTSFAQRPHRYSPVIWAGRSHATFI